MTTRERLTTRVMPRMALGVAYGAAQGFMSPLDGGALGGAVMSAACIAIGEYIMWRLWRRDERVTS